MHSMGVLLLRVTIFAQMKKRTPNFLKNWLPLHAVITWPEKSLETTVYLAAYLQQSKYCSNKTHKTVTDSV